MLERVANFREHDAEAAEMIETRMRDRLVILDEITRDIPLVGLCEFEECAGPRLVWVNPAICEREKANSTPRVHAV